MALVRRRQVIGLLGASAATIGVALPVLSLARDGPAIAQAGPQEARAVGQAVALQNVGGLSRFSALPPGLVWREASVIHQGWRLQSVRGVSPAQFMTVVQPGLNGGPIAETVLRIDVDGSAAALVHEVNETDRHIARLAWRWRADGFPPGVPGVRDRDDFAARVYLMFDYPIDRVPLAQRLLIRAARAFHDPGLPAATLVYLMTGESVVNTRIDSPYSSRVKMIVARAQASKGLWHTESRDVLQDFQEAFGAEYGSGRPRLQAIAVGADGDQTQARFTSWFGDLTTEA